MTIISYENKDGVSPAGAAEAASYFFGCWVLWSKGRKQRFQAFPAEIRSAQPACRHFSRDEPLNNISNILILTYNSNNNETKTTYFSLWLEDVAAETVALSVSGDVAEDLQVLGVVWDVENPVWSKMSETWRLLHENWGVCDVTLSVFGAGPAWRWGPASPGWCSRPRTRLSSVTTHNKQNPHEKKWIFVVKWNMLMSRSTDLTLLTQNHFDGIGGNHNLHLLFLDVFQFELVLCRQERSRSNTSSLEEREKKKVRIDPSMIVTWHGVSHIKTTQASGSYF